MIDCVLLAYLDIIYMMGRHQHRRLFPSQQNILANELPRPAVAPAGRLIQQQHQGVSCEGQGEGESPSHAPRERHRHLLGMLSQAWSCTQARVRERERERDCICKDL